MQAKIKEQQKKTSKQTKLSPTKQGGPQWSRHLSRGAQRRRLLSCLLIRGVVCWKIMISF